jgi:hypothetical protein
MARAQPSKPLNLGGFFIPVSDRPFIEISMTIDKQDSRPWHKEPLVWLILGIPMLSVFWGVVMITLAVDSKDSLVSDSYYKDGVNYTENVNMDNKAKRLQLSATLVFVDDMARLVLDGYLDEEPNSLVLNLIHPTLQEQDSSIFLQRTEESTYTGVSEITLPARRRLWLQSPEQGWRLRSSGHINANQVIQLKAQ